MSFSTKFDFVLDRDAEVPIGVQLAWALRTRIRDGRLQPGARLPGLRELAEALGINSNTARAVYQRLEHEGIIDCQQGSGTFVCAEPERSSTVGAIAANAADEAHQTGVDPREVAAALYVAADPSARGLDERARRRHQLRTQITALERTLAELEAKHPGLAPKPVQASGGHGPRLLDGEDLEALQGDLIRRLAAMQVAIDQLGRPQRAGKEQAVLKVTAPKRTTGRAQVQPKRAPAKPRRATAKPRPAPAGA